MSPRLVLSAVFGALLMAGLGGHPSATGNAFPVLPVLAAAGSVVLACAVMAWLLVRILHRCSSCPHLRTVRS